MIRGGLHGIADADGARAGDLAADRQAERVTAARGDGLEHRPDSGMPGWRMPAITHCCSTRSKTAHAAFGWVPIRTGRPSHDSSMNGSLVAATRLGRSRRASTGTPGSCAASQPIVAVQSCEGASIWLRTRDGQTWSRFVRP